MICKFLCLWNKISKPAFSVEDDYLSVISYRCELVLLVSYVLQGNHSVLVYEWVVIPKGLGVRERVGVVVPDCELFLVGAY